MSRSDRGGLPSRLTGAAVSGQAGPPPLLPPRGRCRRQRGRARPLRGAPDSGCCMTLPPPHSLRDSSPAPLAADPRVILRIPSPPAPRGEMSRRDRGGLRSRLTGVAVFGQARPSPLLPPRGRCRRQRGRARPLRGAPDSGCCVTVPLPQSLRDSSRAPPAGDLRVILRIPSPPAARGQMSRSDRGGPAPSDQIPPHC